MKIQINLIMT